MPQEVTAIVAESLPVFREAILRMLTYDLAVRVNHVVENLQEALDLIIATRPSLAVIDRELPGRDALEVVALALQRSPRTQIMLTAAHFSDADIVRACRTGVRACVLKSDTTDEIRAAMKAVLAGQAVFSRGLRGRVAVRSERDYCRAGATSPFKELTTREIQVLTYVARGLSTKEIATVLNVSTKTVDEHKANFMAKLDIHDRVLLTHYAIRQGLVSV